MQSLVFIKKHLGKIFLSLVLLFLFFKNYTPGTWLIGWDNLIPELNIWMNLKRSISAVWQQYQGLGLVGGMAHAADLIRQLIILPFVLLLPNSFIRYLWHFFTIALGTFGVYFGLIKIFKKQDKNSSPIPLLSSLFYLLNFGTIQNFWVPFEPFSAFWGFFPWLIFTLWDYLQNPSSKNLKKIVIFNLLAIPSFYVQTVFIVYLLCVFLIIISYFIIHQENWKLKVKTTLKTFLIILALNSFWLLPFTYFAKNDITNPQLGFGNLMASEETFLRNQNRGHLSDFLLLRGYYFDFNDSGRPLMSVWKDHLSNPFVLISGYILSSFVIVGLIHLLISNSPQLKFQKLSLIFIFFLCALALLSATPPFSFLNSVIRHISLLDQVFRSPFTKFVTPYVFSFTLLFAAGLEFLFRSLSVLKRKSIPLLTSILIGVILTYFSYPAFTGNFIYPQMRQKIPNEYFKLVDYFKTVPKNERIANLPSGSFWGWTNYRYGVRGSGFIWYGLSQPVLDRAFDVWNLKNEQYYWELNQAIQTQDSNLLQKVFDKYSVSYVIFDNNVFLPDEKIYADLATPTRDLLNKMPNLKLEKQFNQIYIYKNHLNTKSFITTAQSINRPDFSYRDQAYLEYGNYASAKNPDIIYPFSDLFTNRLPSENNFEFEISPRLITIKKNLSLGNNYNLYFDTSLIINHHSKDKIEVSFPYSRYFQWNNPTPNEISLNSVNNSQKIITENNQNHIRFTSFDTTKNVLAKYFSEITFDKSYLIEVEYRNISGYPLTLSAFNEMGRHYFFNTKLLNKNSWQKSYFIIPKSENSDFNSGLTLLFTNQSLNQKPSINDIKSVNIYPFEYEKLLNLKLAVSPLDQKGSYFVYPESYHPGWLAFYFDHGKPIFLKDHISFNNWSNAWKLPSSVDVNSKFHVIFWPQILELVGLILLVLIPLKVLKRK
jgi:hypothetical protein